MSSIEITAKTVEEAVETALKELQVDRDQIEVEVLEEGSKGLFGILGSRMARVRVTVKEDPMEIGKEFLRPIIKSLGVEVTTEERREGNYCYLSLRGSKLGIIIGHRGETLDALQYLTNLAVNKRVKNKVHFILDVEGYRKKREATLKRLALRLSEKAKRTGKKVVLEPMSPQERRIIHTALQDDPHIQTYSEGEEPFRKVVISVK
ncbi:MAG: protein jag [Clostridia bacterium]|jgi:spoIIIJ-associated protein|nr:protein jag [Clostridia bacterium]